MAKTEKIAQSIKVRVISREKLERLTLESQEDWYDMRGWLFERPDEATLTRWMVNTVRHELTRYDSVLYHNKGKVGVGPAHDLLKTAILDKIAIAYPYLAAECERQKNQGYPWERQIETEERDEN